MKERKGEEKSDIGEEEQNGWFEVELTVGWNGVSSVLTCVCYGRSIYRLSDSRAAGNPFRGVSFLLSDSLLSLMP